MRNRPVMNIHVSTASHTALQMYKAYNTERRNKLPTSGQFDLSKSKLVWLLQVTSLQPLILNVCSGESAKILWFGSFFFRQSTLAKNSLSTSFGHSSEHTCQRHLQYSSQWHPWPSPVTSLNSSRGDRKTEKDCRKVCSKDCSKKCSNGSCEVLKKPRPQQQQRSQLEDDGWMIANPSQRASRTRASRRRSVCQRSEWPHIMMTNSQRNDTKTVVHPDAQVQVTITNDYGNVEQFKKGNFDWYRQKQQHQWQALQTWHRTSMTRKNIESHPSIIGFGTLSYFLWCKNYCATSNPILTVLDSMILELVVDRSLRIVLHNRCPWSSK